MRGVHTGFADLNFLQFHVHLWDLKFEKVKGRNYTDKGFPHEIKRNEGDKYLHMVYF